MTIKHFMTDHPGWFTTTLQDTYGGQELKIGAGYELYELMAWWKDWKEIMQNKHPSVQDALQQVKVVHELSKEQPKANTYTWTEAQV